MWYASKTFKLTTRPKMYLGDQIRFWRLSRVGAWPPSGLQWVWGGGGCGSPAKQEVAPSSFSVQSDLSIASRGTNDPGYRVCNSSYLIGCAQIRLFKNNLVLDMHLRNVMRMSNVSKVSWIVMRKRISFLKHYNRPRYDKEDQQKGFRKFIRKNKISTYFSRYLCSLFKVWWLRVQDR